MLKLKSDINKSVFTTIFHCRVLLTAASFTSVNKFAKYLLSVNNQLLQKLHNFDYC